MRLLCRMIGLALLSLPAWQAASGAPVQPAPAARLPFLANEGQVPDATVRFVARTFGGLVAVHEDGALTYSLPRYEPAPASDRTLRRPSGAHVIRERLEGGRAAAPQGAEARAATASFFTGSDPAAWRTAVASYDAVEVGEVYDGIRLRLRAGANNVEKIFTVAPGADPARIRVGLEGADAVRVRPDGRLELDTPLGPVSFSAPVAFQERAGQREPVTVAYALAGGGYGFELGAYDPALPLVIDPLLSSTFIGGTGDDVGLAIARDGDGNIYVAGYTASLNFPVTNSFGMSHAGMWDAFVAKLDYRLTNVLAGAFLGGSQDDAGLALAVEGDTVVLAGVSASANYPVTASAYDRFHNGGQDAVVSVLNRELTILLYSTYLGGAGDDAAHAVGVDINGYIQVAGQTASVDFPVTGNPLQTVLKGPSAAFASRFSANLGVLTASTFLGGDADDAAYAMALQTAAVVLAGRTWSTNFPVATNGYQRVLRGDSDAFVARMPLILTNVLHGTYLGGTNNEAAYAVTLDDGARTHHLSAVVTSLYVTGFTDSGNFPTNTIFGGRTFGNALSGTQDAFLARMPIVCTSLFAGTYVGGAETDAGRGLALDSVGRFTNDVIVAGHTDSSDFPVTKNGYDRTANGLEDGYLIRLMQTLTNQIVAGTYLGGADNDRLNAVLRAGQDLYVAGYSASANYPVMDTAFEITYYGSNDVVVSRLGASLAVGTLRWRAHLPAGRCYPPVQDMQGNIYVLAANSGFDGYLYSFSPEGATNWYIPVSMAFEMASGANVSPAVDLAGNIYLGGGGSGRLYGYRPDGVQFLNFNVGQWFKNTPAISSQTNLIIGNWGGGAPRALHSVSPLGYLNWKTNIPSSSIRSTAAIAADGTSYVGSDSDGLMAHSAAGVRLWRELEGVNMASSPALGSNGMIYVGGAQGNLYALDSVGAQFWTWPTAVTAPINGSPVITSNGSIVVLTATNLIVVTTNGALQWSSGKMTNNDSYMSPAIGSEGTILCPSSNHLFAFETVGSVFATNWVFTAPVNGLMSAPSIALDGTIYVGGMSNLYALFGTESLGQTAWPMVHHDALHTGNQGLNPLPATPLNLTATKGDPIDRIRVNWDFALNASRYELYRATNASLAAATNLLVVMRGNVYYDPNITPGRRYYYRVRAKNSFGNSPLSATDYGGIPPLPPAVVRATKGTPLDRINVSWSLADYATSYEVWRSTNAEPTMATNLLAISSGTSLVDTAIALGVKYYYFVKSTNEFGASVFSAPDYGGTPPQAFAPTAGDGVSLDVIPVSWPFSAGGQTFELWRSVYDIPITASLIASQPGTNFIDSDIVPSNVVPCRLYYYWVKVTNEFGTSAFSPSDSGWRALYTPGDFRASDGGVYSTKVHTAWAPVPYGITYELYRGTSPVFSQASYLNRVGGFEFDDTSVTRGGTYYYWARTWNDYGASAWVGPDAGGTPALAPTGLTATEGDFTDRILVNWQGAYGASGYLLYRGTSIDPGFASLLLATPNASYEDRATTPGQRYYYWARATNVFGPSSLSASDSGFVSLSPPDGLVASDGAYTNRVNIVWNEAPGATTYEVYRNTANNTGTATRLVYTAERTFDDTLVTPGVLYYYWIRAKTASFSSGLGQPDTGYAASGLADLQVYDFVFLPTRMGLYTSPDAVSFRLRNAGPQPLFGSNTRISMDFYVSANDAFGDADDVWFGSATQDVTLPVGGETLVALSGNQRIRLEIPYLDTGSYYIYMIVRHAYPSSYLDPDMSSNVVRRPDPTTIHSFAPAVYAGVNDYNGDGRADLAAYDFANGRWYIRTLDGAILAWAEAWGGSGMIPVLGDFDSDRNADLAVYDTATGLWYIRRLDGGIIAWAVPWGGPGFMPVWGDYDGDGSVDLAVYEAATGNWFVRTLSGTLLGWGVPWGGTGFAPVMGDYNGDGRQDLAVYQAASWSWFVRSLYGSVLVWAEPWGGTTGFIPVPGDFDGDGQADLAVYHAATGYWFIKRAAGDVIAWGDFWGGAGMNPVPGDYDGDGRSDLAVFSTASGAWYIRSLNGTILAWSVSWGGGSIRPVGMGE